MYLVCHLHPHTRKLLLVNNVRISITLLFLVALGSFADGQAHRSETAQGTLRQYVGARLRGAEWKDYSRLITWPDEAGWDCYWVVKGHSIGAAVRHGTTAVIPVAYSRVGLFCSDPSFQPEPKNIVIRYELVYRGTSWKVNGPIPDYPDISWDALEASLKETAADPHQPDDCRKQATEIRQRIAKMIR